MGKTLNNFKADVCDELDRNECKCESPGAREWSPST
jgi:hypothetical protein